MSNFEWCTAINPHIVDNSSDSSLSTNYSSAANRSSRNRGASTHPSNRGRGRGNKTRLFFGSRQADDSRANYNPQNRSRSASRARTPTFRSNTSDSVRDKTAVLEDLGLNPDQIQSILALTSSNSELSDNIFTYILADYHLSNWECLPTSLTRRVGTLINDIRLPRLSDTTINQLRDASVNFASDLCSIASEHLSNLKENSLFCIKDFPKMEAENCKNIVIERLLNRIKADESTLLKLFSKLITDAYPTKSVHFNNQEPVLATIPPLPSPLVDDNIDHMNSMSEKTASSTHEFIKGRSRLSTKRSRDQTSPSSDSLSKKSKGIPLVGPEYHTMVISDSTTARWPRTNGNIYVWTHSGLTIKGLASLIYDWSPPDHLKTIIIVVGVNNYNLSMTQNSLDCDALHDALSGLKHITSHCLEIAINNKHTHVAHKRLNEVNKRYREIFTDKFIPFEVDLTFDDLVHYSENTAELIADKVFNDFL